MAGILFYHDMVEDGKFRAEWERVRIQTFYLINIQLDKKNKMTYEKFREDIWPFAWEKRKKIKSDPEQIMTQDQWETIFNKKTIETGETGEAGMDDISKLI